MNFKSLKSDIPASLVVFLVALPLCLGIALASGAPLMAGIVSGIVGGLVVGAISQSQTSVSGPAAGLVAVVLAAMAQLGSWQLFLSAVVLAGVLQLIMGVARLGFIAYYVPSNIIQGLLASIGIVLITKQIPHAIGFDLFKDDYIFYHPDGENTVSTLVRAIEQFVPGAVLISVLSIGLMLVWPRTALARYKFLPSSLFVVVLGLVLNQIFGRWLPALYIEPSHMVSIPAFSVSQASETLHLPSLADLSNYKVWIVAVTIALIASLETLLNIEAVDKMDPHKRESPPNRELIAQGAGNLVAGFLGGLPVTSVIVRSSVNLNAGAETKASTLLHGLFLLLSLLVLSPVLNLIPLASLAAILLLTGYKLARISLFKEMWAKGHDQFIPFVVTILAILFTDLLIGVVIGSVVSVLFLLYRNYRNPFVLEEETLHIGEVIRLEFPSQVGFFNKASIKRSLWHIPAGSRVIIDATKSDFIDSDVLDILDDFRTVVAPERNIQLNVLGLKGKYELHDHIQFINVLDSETQNKLSPAQVLDLLKAGNERFVEGKWSQKYYLHQVNATSLGQHPMAVFVGCIDSRTSPEVLFDTGIGDILTVRIAGNIITPEIVGSLEISVKKLGAKLIVIKGHSNCGAVGLAMADVTDGNMGLVTNKIIEVAKIGGYLPKPAHQSQAELVDNVARANIRHSIEEVLHQSDYLRQMVERNELGIVSAFHHIQTGRVEFCDLQYLQTAPTA